MKVLAVASQKGGSGKTTLAGHIAVQSERMGAGPVALVDTDPQGSLSDWWNVREADTPVFARTAMASLARDVDRMRAYGIGLLVIDTPPAITSTIAIVIALSDFVLIPSRPSPHDLRAAGATIDIVRQMGKPMSFVLNGASARARITAEAAAVLAQHGPLVPTIIHQRTDYAASMIDGRTVMECASSARAREEIAALWHYLDCSLNGTTGPVDGRRDVAAAGSATTGPAEPVVVASAPTVGATDASGDAAPAAAPTIPFRGDRMLTALSRYLGTSSPVVA